MNVAALQISSIVTVIKTTQCFFCRRGVGVLIPIPNRTERLAQLEINLRKEEEEGGAVSDYRERSREVKIEREIECRTEKAAQKMIYKFFVFQAQAREYIHVSLLTFVYSSSPFAFTISQTVLSSFIYPHAGEITIIQIVGQLASDE